MISNGCLKLTSHISRTSVSVSHFREFSETMAGRLLAANVRKAIKAPKLNFSTTSTVASDGHNNIIGNREVVGYGFNGQASYVDRPDFPLPAIRWKEPTQDILALREKEKGDWKKLSIEEKKALYRASFRQTFAEFKAPTGEWKSILGTVLFFVSLGIWGFYGLKTFVYSPLPDSFKDENRRAQFRRILDLKVDPIQGLASQWDYEKDDWKK